MSHRQLPAVSLRVWPLNIQPQAREAERLVAKRDEWRLEKTFRIGANEWQIASDQILFADAVFENINLGDKR
jgi:hypothetical protein